MSLVVWILVVLFVVTDVVVITLVIRRFRSQMLGTTLPGANHGKIMTSAHAMVGEYLKANYSGDPGHLPTALCGLLPRLRELLESQGVDPRPETIRALIEVSAARHRIASAKELREALDQAGPGPSGATRLRASAR